MSGLARVFGALFTSLGVPIPTQITPKILNAAKEIIDKGEAASSISVKLLFGKTISDRIERQDGKFYTLEYVVINTYLCTYLLFNLPNITYVVHLNF